MKKQIWKLASLFAAVLALSLCFAGCSSDDDDDGGSSGGSGDYTGTWYIYHEYTSTEYEHVTDPISGETLTKDNTTYDGRYSYIVTLVLNGDGTGTITSSVDNKERDVKWEETDVPSYYTEVYANSYTLTGIKATFNETEYKAVAAIADSGAFLDMNINDPDKDGSTSRFLWVFSRQLN